MPAKPIFKLLLGGFFACLVFLCLPKATFAATLAVSPTSNSVTVGSTFTVNIILDTTGQAVFGADIDSLHFNPTVLQVQDALSTTTGVQIAPGSLMPINEYNNVDNTNGVIQFSQTIATGGSNFTGSGILASITFQALATGTSALTFDFTVGSTNQCVVAVLYSNALTAVTNGSYTVTAASDTTPPTVPAGLTATATSASTVNLSWTASTDPTVGGQTTSGLAGYKIYRGGSQIATSATNSYSDSGLTAATQYTYTVAAYDNAGNTSAQSGSASATTKAALPAISNLVGSNTTASTTQISWNTNVATNGQVFYGLTVSYGSSSALVDNSPKTTSHTVTLSGLSAATTYHFKATSIDASGNSTSTPDFTFTTTSGPDTTAPSVPTVFPPPRFRPARLM